MPELSPNQPVRLNSPESLRIDCRHASFLDLAQGLGQEIIEGTQDHDFIHPPFEVQRRLAQTGLAPLIIPPGEFITRMWRNGLLVPGELWRPVARERATRIFLRTGVRLPGPDQRIANWERTIAAVFHFYYDAEARQIISGFELGMLMCGDTMRPSISKYRVRFVYVDDELDTVEDTETFGATGAEVDEFVSVVAEMAQRPFLSHPSSDSGDTTEQL